MNTLSATLELATGDDWVPLRVLSRHQHALNLVTPTDTLFAMVTPYHGNGPFHVVISPAQLAQLQQQPAIYLQAHNIVAGSLTLRLASFARWDPHLPALSARPAQSLPALYQRYQVLGQPALGVVTLTQDPPSTTKPTPGLSPLQFDHTAQVTYQRAQQALALLSSGLYEENMSLITEGVKLLAGLGPGLTPAGDDFLVGLLAAFYALGPDYAQQPGPSWPMYARLIADTARSHTTRLSAAWLTHAGAGRFGEPWHNLIQAMNANQSQAIRTCTERILATGATSGADAMSGFLWGSMVLERMVTG